MHLQWDEGLLTMSKGETARLEIEPEWAYGKKGVPDNKYPFRAQKYCVKIQLYQLLSYRLFSYLYKPIIKFTGGLRLGIRVLT